MGGAGANTCGKNSKSCKRVKRRFEKWGTWGRRKFWGEGGGGGVRLGGPRVGWGGVVGVMVEKIMAPYGLEKEAVTFGGSKG